MKREKWIVGVRNTLASPAGECDSAASIEGAKMTRAEREELQDQLRASVKWIDERIMR